MCKNTTANNGSNAKAELTSKFSGIMYATKDIPSTISTGKIIFKNVPNGERSIVNSAVYLEYSSSEFLYSF